MLASQRGNFAIVKLLVAAQADVNAQNARGTTALQLAVIKGQIEIVSILLKNGANPKIMDKVNATLQQLSASLLSDNNFYADGNNSNGRSKNV